MNTKTNDTRQHILNVGYQLIVEKGFTSVGLSQLLKEADVPKGSFYHYFKSKEQFGEALIKDYFEQYLDRLDNAFNHSEGNHYERLTAYFSRWLLVDDGKCNAHKCLVVKLSAEVSDLSEPMRQALNKGAEQVISSIATCIQSGIADGSIIEQNSENAAKVLYSMWLGSSLLSKLNQTTDSLKLALTTTESMLS
ncbi:TetR/AcrR family transcriptional regulator, partial [Vibrio makurazakiensis]|uniref:TetR/AcrR family transcriptional regulator n=1 Tax=Vibrio makurazakiensis TaxID=2910250 RepID=UPI003D15096F